MKLKFTLNILFSCVFIFLVALGNAQDANMLTITSPASIAGTYEVRNSSQFGAALPAGTMGTFQLVDDGDDADFNMTDNPGGNTADGCNGTINDLTGNWAFMDRGDCGFSLKALRVQEEGNAVGVIICNWEVDGNAIDMAAGDEADMVNIAAVSMSTADCATLKMAITTGDFAEGTFGYVEPMCEFSPPPSTIWGLNGEGTFSDGLGDWTSSSESGDEADQWVYEADNTANGPFGGADKFLDSESNCDGAALIDFDALTTGPNPNPVQPYPYHIANLTSPIMDLSGSENPIIKFYSRYNYLNGQAGTNRYSEVHLSADGGQTWIDTFLMPQPCANNDFPCFTSDLIQIPADALAGASEARIKFWGAGDFYYWLIDDVHVTDEQLLEVQANDFFNGATYFRTPVGQVDDEIPFLIDIQNIGNTPVENTIATVEVTKESNGEVVFTSSYDYGTTDPNGGQANDGIYQNQVFPETFTVPSEVENYTINYTVTGDDDIIVDNNTKTRRFEVTEWDFGQVLPENEGGDLGGIWFGATVPYYSIGNTYYVPNGEDHYVTGSRFGTGLDFTAATFSGFLNFTLHKWIDLNDDQMCQPDERLLLGTYDRIVSSALMESYRDVQIDWIPASGESTITLENESHYVVMCHMNPINAADDGGYTWLADSAPSALFNAVDLARDSIGLALRTPGLVNTTGGDGNDVDTRTFSPFSGRATFFPLSIQLISGTEDLNPDIAITAFPNPASNLLNVDVSLENVSETVTTELVSISGQVVLSQTIKNVKTDRVELNTSSLSSGVYILNVKTDEGLNTEKVVIQK